MDARKQRLDAAAAWTLLSGASVVHVAKGRTLRTWHPGRDDRAAILADGMGPSGNLRAPTLRVGSTVRVGFHEDSYRALLD